MHQVKILLSRCYLDIMKCEPSTRMVIMKMMMKCAQFLQNRNTVFVLISAHFPI